MVVTEINSPQLVSMVARTLENNLPQVIDIANPSFDQGQGHFTLRYTGSFTSLLEQIERGQDRFPFKLHGDKMNPASFELRLLKPGEDSDNLTDEQNSQTPAPEKDAKPVSPTPQ